MERRRSVDARSRRRWTGIDRPLGLSASFDFNADGYAERAGWVRPDDGILVRDLNGNGRIDNVTEMFGRANVSGFAQLAALDGNHDGKVDASDNGLADFNGDGTVSQNSNTFIATILEDAGVPLPTGAPVGMTLIPGFQYRLHNPLRSVGYPPTSLDATDFIFSNPNGTTTKIVVGDPVTITLTWGVGTLSLDIDGQSETNQVETVTSITAANGHVALIGTSGNDIIDGEGSDTLIAGGPGNDTIIGYGGSDWMDGGGGNDTVTYAAIADSLAVTLATVNGTTETGDPIIKVSGITTGGSDTIVLVETIRLGSGQDRITVASADDLNTKLTVDMADSDRQVSPFNLDVYDLSNLSEGVTYRSGKVALGWSGPLSSFAGFAENLVVKNADKIVLTPFDDTVISANYGNVIYTGAGADKIWIGSDGVAIDDLSEFGERGRLCGQGPDRTAVPTDVYFWPEADLPRAGPRCSVRHRRQTSSRRH